MLESLRKQGASIFIYLIFGLLIVIFVINFAPNAGQGGGGCMGQSTTAVKVDGHKANQTSYKIAYSGNQYTGRQKVYVALEMLIRRELLAQEAEKRGLRVTGDMLDEEIKKGYFFLGGNRNKLDFWIDDVDGEKFFNFGKLRGWVGQLNVSMNSYKDEQARGLQAALMAEMLADTVRVSREEALADYLFENNTVTYDMVEFSATPYKNAMRLTDADVERFLAGHEAEVKKKFTDDERTYKATKPALKLRSIFIQKLAEAPKPADEPKPADGAGSGSAAGSAAPPAEKPADKAPEPKKPDVKPVGMPIDAAKATLTAARKSIADGKQKFADAAKLLNTDDAAKANGGFVGWKPVDNAQLGDKAVNDAVKALKPGEMTDVITTDNGAYLVIAEDKREGDLTYDQVKHEIAMELAKDVWSKEAAKRAALDALASARAGT
ncbi:MAG: SurA N-terminal domain-containing protein, partial [Kofleriaceae bacterium]